MACRYLVTPDDLKTPVSDEELRSARDEVVAAIAYAQKLCTDPGPKPPLMVLAGLRQVVDLKQRALDLEQARRKPVAPSEEAVASLFGIFLEALVRAQVPDHCRVEVAREIRKVARERFGVDEIGDGARSD